MWFYYLVVKMPQNITVLFMAPLINFNCEKYFHSFSSFINAYLENIEYGHGIFLRNLNE